MTPRKVITALLLVFVVASLGVVVFRSAVGTESPVTGSIVTAPNGAEAAIGQPPQASSRRLIAYYFHGTRRCNTCRAIESRSREALEGGFPEALVAGRLEWRSVDTDEPANDHFVSDFGLTGSSLVLVDEKDGVEARHKTLSRTWDLYADKAAFLAYVQSEVKSWLETP